MSGSFVVGQRTRDGLVQLVNRTFKLYRCSPLNCFRTDQRALQRYEIALHHSLCSGLELRSRKDGVPSQENARGDLVAVTMTPLPITGWSVEDNALEIKIQILFKGKDKETIVTVIMFPSRTRPADLPDNFRTYPVIFVNGMGDVGVEVNKWIEVAFDCSISALVLPSSKLYSIVEWWCSHLSDIPATEAERIKVPRTRTFNSQKLQLVYAVPEAEDISDITIEIRTEDLMNIHGIVRDSHVKLVDAIEQHIFNTTRIRVSMLPVVRIGTPLAALSKDGKFKVIPNSPKDQVFHLLDELCTLASSR